MEGRGAFPWESLNFQNASTAQYLSIFGAEPERQREVGTVGIVDFSTP
jgi:hypothetical protein